MDFTYGPRNTSLVSHVFLQVEHTHSKMSYSAKMFWNWQLLVVLADRNDK